MSDVLPTVDAPVRLDGAQPWPLWDSSATRAAEERARRALAPGTLMHRAGRSVARLALALAPHARQAWVAAGPGGNGGDGLHAAAHLRRRGLEVHVTLLADAAALSPEPAQALARAREAGCIIGTTLPGTSADIAVDALLGIGTSRAPGDVMLDAIRAFNGMAGCRLAVDLPSGLHPDTGARLGADAACAHATLALLTLKPALFTGSGREHAGEAWLDELGCDVQPDTPPLARLSCGADVQAVLTPRPHDRHKGSFGDVLVIGGAPGMAGAARLAAQGAHAAGPGRVFVSPLDPHQQLADPLHPQWLWTAQAWLPGKHDLGSATVVCGCGGGWAVTQALPAVLARALRLVLDADALNAVARDAQLRRQLRARQGRGLATVLTPHPLEAARLLGCDTAQVQADRLRAALTLAQDLGAIVLLKGSGTVLARPGQPPKINPTGSASLSAGGTGDVLAGWIGGMWASCGAIGSASEIDRGWAAAVASAWLHGKAGERPGGTPVPPEELARTMAEHALAWRAGHGTPAFSGARAWRL